MNLPSQLFHWFQQRNAHPCHRQLLIISGDQDWGKIATKILIDRHNIKSALWVGEEQTQFDRINIKDYRTKLGQEYDWVILDAFNGFRASAAMALSGSIKSQGVMILICPEFHNWPSYADPEQCNRTSFGYKSKLSSSHFIQYLTSCIGNDNSVAVVTRDNFKGDISPTLSSNEDATYNEQQQAVSDICRVATGRNKRPLVITADRGRGKSSALGIASAKLMQTSNIKIWLTAPNIKNVEQVFSHSLRLLPDATFDKQLIKLQSSSLNFKPLDFLLQSDELPDILLVDEASAIPVYVLLKLTQKFSRIAFTSTIHGYEGSGRGFDIKFKQRLKELRPNCKILHISHPIRWLPGDVLESFWFNTLFYRTNFRHAQQTVKDNLVEYKSIYQAELLANPAILEDVFRLLLDAHYQTSPDDLQRLLDSPEVKCFIILQNGIVLGVAQVIEEGGECLTPLSSKIAANTKRVKGHLVAQNIASSYNQAEFCSAKQWRVSRIAVIPSHQRMGYATTLLEYIEAAANKEDIAFLTVAFGASYPLLRVWHQQGYLPVKLSLRPEVSSGEHSCMHIKPLTAQSLVTTNKITSEFYQDLLFYMDKALNRLSAEVLLEILIHCIAESNFSKITMIEQFIDGTRTLLSCKRVLVEALLHNINNIKLVTREEQNLLIELLLQNDNYENIANRYNLTGKKQIEQKVRGIFSAIIENTGIKKLPKEL